MGLRYRKSVNFGGVRINASKSGLGWSVGVPGVRYTKMANGRTRATASIPGTGISWVSESKKQSEIDETEEELTGWPLFWYCLEKTLEILFWIVVIGLFGVFYILGEIDKRG